MAPTAGQSSQRAALLCRSRWMCTAIQRARASRTSGQTQSTAGWAEDPRASRMMPLAPSTTAGTTAQRFGCVVNRVESAAKTAQPIANPQRTAPVSALSVTGTTGAATRAAAARNPAASDPATTTDMGAWPRRGDPTDGSEGEVLDDKEDGATCWVAGVEVVMASSCGC